MKRKTVLLLVIVMALLPLPASKLSWNPSVSLNGGLQRNEFTSSIESSGNASSAFFVEGKLVIPSLRIGESLALSIPVYAGWVSSSRISARTEKQQEATFGAEAEAGLRCHERFSLSIGGGFRLHCYLESEGWYLSYGGTLTPTVLIGIVPVSFPLSVYIGRNGAEIRFAAGLKLGAV